MVDQDKDKGLVEKLIKLNRVAKVVKGGRRFSFSALVVVGDQNGSVGYGFGKANDVSEAIRKGMDKAKRNMFKVPVKNKTIPHEVIARFKSAKIVMKPAAPGTGVIAGGAVRAVMDAVGINDILSKSLGSKNSINIVKAVFSGFNDLMDAKKVSADRGKSISEMWG
ncbi:MAG: 30S ribosomal protein S5 [Spirochaetaceae bacterium]|nr:30S ribosomal protein S5 [Spirochaetaceae bacterium]